MLFNSAQKVGFKYIESLPVMEDNTRMQADMEKLGGKIYKTYSVFTGKRFNVFYKGIFPCFFFGNLSTLFSSILNARINRCLVTSGLITSSI